MSEVNVSVLPQQVAQENRLQRPLRIALFGFGTVGSSVARILVESKPQGLELSHVFNRDVARKRVDWTPASVEWSEDADAGTWSLFGNGTFEVTRPARVACVMTPRGRVCGMPMGTPK